MATARQSSRAVGPLHGNSLMRLKRDRQVQSAIPEHRDQVKKGRDGAAM